MWVLRCVPGGQSSLIGILLLLHITDFTFGILLRLRMDCRCYYNNKNKNNSNNNDNTSYNTSIFLLFLVNTYKNKHLTYLKIMYNSPNTD